jgi:hypothetical protein
MSSTDGTCNSKVSIDPLLAISEVQTTTSGNPSDQYITTYPAISLFAYDDGPVVKNIQIQGDVGGLFSDWPVVMITNPASAKTGLGNINGELNPWASPLTRASSGNVLNAGVFAPTAVGDVLFSINSGPIQAMEAKDNYYQVIFDTPDLDKCQIEVVASAGGVTRSDTVVVNLV